MGEVEYAVRRHPELVSGSIVPYQPSARWAGWMLKQVQHNACLAETL